MNARAEISSGICGYSTKVEARMNGKVCELQIESGCEAVARLAQELGDVDPFQEFSFRGDGPETLRMAAKHCSHAACPVPTGIIKAVEIAAGLALPQDVHIRLMKFD